MVTLAHRNPTGLAQFLANVQTAGNASYGHYLTPAQFDAQYGALASTRTRIKDALAANGFTVDADRFGASIIEADAPASVVNGYFQTTLHDVTDSEGSAAHLPYTVPTTPAALQSDVVAITGLDTARVAPPAQKLAFAALAVNPAIACVNQCPPCPTGEVGVYPNCFKPGSTPTPAPTPVPTPVPGSNYPATGPNAPIVPPTAQGYTSDTSYSGYSYAGYAPYTYAADYDMPVQHGFGGSSAFPIGIITAADVSAADLQDFYSIMGVNRTGTITRIGTPGTVSDDEYEAALDAETITGLAPAANVYLYEMPSLSDNNIVSTMNIVDTQNAVAVVSMSFGGCEDAGYPTNFEASSAEDSAAAQGSAQGITFVAATGDWGGTPSLHPSCATIQAPAASSYVVAIGGTSPYAANGTPANNAGTPAYAFETAASGGGWQFAWGQQTPVTTGPCASNGFCGSAGGQSTHFTTPEQLNACGDTYRCVPDLSFAADYYYPGFLVFQGSPRPGADGTSFATPIFAAMQAEIDQRQNARKGNVVVNIYSAWRKYGYGAYAVGAPAPFHDITQGNNGYQAISGFDWASGIGSVDGFALSSVE